MTVQLTAPYSDVVEILDLAWAASTELRSDAFHHGRAPCRATRDRHCGGQCDNTVSAMAVKVATDLGEQGIGRAEWRRRARTACRQLADLAHGAVLATDGPADSTHVTIQDRVLAETWKAHRLGLQDPEELLQIVAARVGLPVPETKEILRRIHAERTPAEQQLVLSA